MIRFQQVTKQFTPDSFGAQDVSFDINPGEIVFITGKSGSGKTTLGRLITKEYTPTSGEIFFNDKPLSEIKSGKVHEHRRSVGVVFQDYRLLPELTARENIALPLSILNLPKAEATQRVEDLLALVSLLDKGDLFPSQLSGGEAQRVSIARALAMSPQVLFADEPTGNLDPETSMEIAKILEKINELGTTILFATHDESLMGGSSKHRLIRIENGKIVKDTGVKETVSNAATPASTTSNVEITSETEPEDDTRLRSGELLRSKEEKNPKKPIKDTKPLSNVVSPDKIGKLPKITKAQPKSWRRLMSIGLPKFKLPSFKSNSKSDKEMPNKLKEESNEDEPVVIKMSKHKVTKEKTPPRSPSTVNKKKKSKPSIPKTTKPKKAKKE